MSQFLALAEKLTREAATKRAEELAARLAETVQERDGLRLALDAKEHVRRKDNAYLLGRAEAAEQARDTVVSAAREVWKAVRSSADHTDWFDSLAALDAVLASRPPAPEETK